MILRDAITKNSIHLDEDLYCEKCNEKLEIGLYKDFTYYNDDTIGLKLLGYCPKCEKVYHIDVALSTHVEGYDMRPSDCTLNDDINVVQD